MALVKASYSDIINFTDDPNIFGKVGSSESRDKLNEDMRVLCEWCDNWQMKLNTHTCKVLHNGAKSVEEKYFMEVKKNWKRY